jgi:hypothetical protein
VPKIDEHQLDHGTKTGDRRPDRGAEDAHLADRGIEDPVRELPTSPRVTLMMPPISSVPSGRRPPPATSSPMRKTSGSLAIAILSASAMAKAVGISLGCRVGDVIALSSSCVRVHVL